jgi:predicted nucleotidyltransferase
MSSYVLALTENGLASPPKHVPSNIQYEVMMGSMAYGVSADSSDIDIYGYSIPRKDMLFPHLAGEIEGFAKEAERFEQYQQHHINDPSAMGGKGRQYDVVIYNIAKYFRLVMDNNPNMIDSLFVPQEYITQMTQVGQMVRDQRHLFLHRGSWHKFRGYAYQQLHKMATKNPEAGSKRQKTREEFGYDVKFAYHVARLLDEAEQILTTGTLDLQRSKEYMKAIRRGEVQEDELRKWAANKENDLERLYHTSTIQYEPDAGKIKALLINCLEHHFGSLDKALVVPDRPKQVLRDIMKLLDNNRDAFTE